MAADVVLLDVNVLVNAMRADAPRHRAARTFVEALRSAPEPFGASDLVLSGVLRVLTHPRVFVSPTPLENAQRFVEVLRGSPNFIPLAPGARHWDIFCDLVTHTRAAGNLISDAWHAALAIEHGCEFVSDDSDFARFPTLRWRRVPDAT